MCPEQYNIFWFKIKKKKKKKKKRLEMIVATRGLVQIHEAEIFFADGYYDFKEFSSSCLRKYIWGFVTLLHSEYACPGAGSFFTGGGTAPHR